MEHRKVQLTDYTYLSSVKSLCEIVCKSGKQYDLVIGSARGGLIPAVFMSHALNRPMGIVHCSSYSDTSKGELETHGWVSPVQSPESILIVDDLADTGHTLEFVKKFCETTFDKPADLATVYYKTGSVVIPDYYATVISSDVWVVFPYEAQP